MKQTNVMAFVAALAVPAFCLALEFVYGTTAGDSSMFRYLAQRVIGGSRLYVDVFDCKGPLLIGANVLGELLFPVGGHGPSVMAFLLWETCLLLFAKWLRGFVVDGWGAATFVFALMPLCTPSFPLRFLNRAEIVAGVFVLAGLLLARRRNSKWAIYGFGICVGGAFMTKPTLVAFAVGMFVTWCYELLVQERQMRTLVRMTAFVFAGFVTAVAVVSACFLPDGLLELWDAHLLYNLFERNLGVSQSWFEWWRDYLTSPFRWGVILGWCLHLFLVLEILALALAIRAWNRRAESRSCLVLLMTWLLCETILAMATKGFWPHYLTLAWMPLAGLFALLSSGKRLNAIRLVALGCCVYLILPVGKELKSQHERSLVRREVFERFAKDAEQMGMVAAFGGQGTAEALWRMKMQCPQRYFAASYWIGNCTERRRQEMIGEFSETLARKSVNWLVSDFNKETIACLCHHDCRIVQALREYEEMASFRDPQVNFYRRHRPVSEMADERDEGGRK